VTADRIPAITLHRPWPFCITGLYELIAKRVENRTWNTRHRGDLLLHAGQRWSARDLQAAGKIVHAAGGPPGLIPAADRDHPTGVVAVVRLVDVCAESAGAGAVVCGCGPWAMPGQYHWRIDLVRVLAVPVECRGLQGLWHPSPGVLAQVAAQIGAPA
jgi:hypothetical protein